MKDKKCFLDTNILLYCYAQDEPIKNLEIRNPFLHLK